MAHELLIEDGEAAMFYTGDKPWHGLGQRLDNPATAAEAIRAARLDWEVTKVPLYIAGGNRLHELPGKHAVVRADRIGTSACRALGIVGDHYVVLQNRDAFAFFDEIAGDGRAIYHTAGALGTGERIWILAKLPGDIWVAGRDAVERFLLLSNSHDGESAVQVKFTPIRVVCHNTLTQALARGFTHTVRHDRDLWGGLRDVQEALGFITREYDALAQAFKSFALVRLDERGARWPTSRACFRGRKTWTMNRPGSGSTRGATGAPGSSATARATRRRASKGRCGRPTTASPSWSITAPARSSDRGRWRTAASCPSAARRLARCAPRRPRGASSRAGSAWASAPRCARGTRP